MDSDTRFLTPPAIARVLGVSPDKVLAWIAEGTLKAANLSSADRPRWKVHPDDLQTCLEGRSNRPKTARRRRDVPSTRKSYV